MRILVLSDSHRREVEINPKRYDYVIHCGDYGSRIPPQGVLFVRGNCDKEGPKELCEEIGGRRVYITHGNLYQVKYGYDRLCYRAMELGAGICFFGHTHRPDMFIHENIVFINPGAYQDGYYVLIDDNSIGFYLDKKCYKKFDFKW